MPSPDQLCQKWPISGTAMILENPTFARGFSACSLTQKPERSGGWRRERNWDRTFSRYSIVGPRSWADWVRSQARPQPSPRSKGCETAILPRGDP